MQLAAREETQIQASVRQAKQGENSLSPLSGISSSLLNSSNLVFIDSEVAEPNALLEGLLPGYQGFVLASNGDGIEQITHILSEFEEVHSLHIVCHGSPGTLQLGTAQLDLARIHHYQEQLQGWAKALADNAQIVLYGCRAAAGDCGQKFVQALYQLTEADILASTTPMGCEAKGGNWTFEVNTGESEASTAFHRQTLNAYHGVLEAKASFLVDSPKNLLKSSTYGSGSFQIENTSTTGQEITRISIDVSSAIFPDIVFDPLGTAGDTGSKNFTVDSDPGVGFQGRSFLGEHDGGFDVLEIRFDNFTPGQTFTFSVDMDPTSTKGTQGPGPNHAASVSGFELTGAVVTVEFDDGTVLQGQNYRVPGDDTASQAILKANLPPAPDLQVLGISGNTATVSEVNQTVRLTGPAGASVSLLRVEGAFYEDALIPAFDPDPFEANTAIAVDEFFVTIGASGFVDVPVTLTSSDPAGGLNHFVAVIKDQEGATSATSSVIVLELAANLPIDAEPPIASLSTSDINAAGGTDYSFTVSYADVSGLDESTTDVNDITVVGPNGSLSVTAATDNGDGSVTYSVSAPGGDWDITDNGTYTVTLQAGEVADTLGNSVSELALGSFTVNIGAPPAPGSSIRIEAESYIGGANGVEYFDTSAGNGGNAAQFTDDVDVNVSDDVEGDFHIAKIKNNEYLTYNLNVAEAGEYTLVARIASGKNGRALNVTIGGQSYTLNFDSTGGAWTDVALPGVFLNAGPQEMRLDIVKGAFELNYFELQPGGGDSPDTAPPAASLIASNITTAGDADYSFTVSYADASGVDGTTFDLNDVVVIGPNGALSVIGATDNGDGTATYTVSAPGGGWAIADNGTYTVTLHAGEVADNVGNSVSELALGSFAVNIGTPLAPGSTIRVEAESYIGGVNGVEYLDTSAGNGGNASQFTDDVDVKVTNDVDGDFHITKINSGEYLTYNVNVAEAGEYTLAARVASGKNGRVLNVTIGGQTYTLNFDSSSGAWTDVVLPGVLLNAGPQAMRVDIVKGAFELNYFEFQTTAPDTTAPSATLVSTSLDLPVDSTAPARFTVEYSDNVAIQSTSLDSQDIQVIAPSGTPLTVSFESVSPAGDGTPLIVTYAIAAPSGGWRPSDNGDYTISILADEVVDTNSNPLEPQQFNLAITVSDPPVTEGIPDLVVLEGGLDSIIDLFAVFEDAQDADAALNYTVQSNTNPGLVSPTIADGSLTLDYAETGAGSAEITVAATDTDNTTTETTFSATVVTPQADDGVIRINAGGGAVYDDQGRLFQADAYSSGGQAVSVASSQPIANTKFDALYQTQRQGGDFSYSIPVDNGNYYVNAHLVEWEATDFNQRLFDVTVEGQVYYDDLDVYGEIKNAFLEGRNTAKVIQGPDKNTAIIATVEDGVLDIDFNASLDEAIIAALEIVPVDAGVLIQETDSTTQVTEGASVDSYTVALATPPTSDVTVTLQFDGGQISTNVASLTFTPSNWNQAQSVVVTPIDDALAEGLHTSIITHTVSSADPDYNGGVPVDSVAVTINDNDGAGGPISFTQQLIATPIKPTSAAFGPDGQLYVASVTGNITVYTLNDDYSVASSEVIDVISNLSNSNITGIAFNPYDTTPKIYVSHNQFYANGGVAFAATEFSPYSGQVSVLEQVNGVWGLTPLVTGIGVSNHDHGVNGLAFDNNGDLYITSGSNTNAGVADTNIGGIDESPFTAAILKAAITKPNFNGDIQYALLGPDDLIQPVPQEFLDGLPSEIFNPPADLPFDPADSQFWGGYVDVVPGVDVSIYASGLRNPYDVVFTTEGLLYATENNANGNFGDVSTGPYTQEAFGKEQPEELNLITEGAYFGHPNRNRGRTDYRQNVYYDSPVDLQPEGYTAPIATFQGSTNGLVEYRATAFGEQLRGNLLAQKWKNQLYSIDLSTDGSQVDAIINLNDVANVTGGTTNGRVAQGLDVITGPGGTIIGVDFTRDELTVAIPNDPSVTSPTAYDIYPWRAPVTGGQSFIIGGANFDTDPGDTRVFIGDQEIVNLGVSETRITGILPDLSSQANELLDVSIRNANGNVLSVISEAFQPLAG